MTQLNKLFAPRQLEVLDQVVNDPTWNLMINYGAVRAGKTFVDNFVFLLDVRHAAEVAQGQGVLHPQYILAGVSSKTIQNNVLNEIENTFGLSFHFDKHNSFEIKFPGLPGVKIVQAFTGSIAGLGAIRGMTAYGAYINEASLANEEVFDEIRKRCSPDGARVVCDTNPDIPTHYLKKKYIDNPNHSKAIRSNHFRIDDNTFLSKTYVQNLKETEPAGMFYDRAIEGEWAAAEGIVYQDFDQKTMIIPRSQIPNNLTIICGVDWGYEHKGCIVVAGVDDKKRYYILEEHTAQFKEIDYWTDVAKDIQKRYGKHVPFYADSARPEHVAHFNQCGIKCINAYKNRLTGVEYVAKAMKTNAFFVAQDAIDNTGISQISDKYHWFLEEIYQYVWDDKTGEPLKVNDDVMDTIRYAIATYERIKNMPKPMDRRKGTNDLRSLGLIN